MAAAIPSSRSVLRPHPARLELHISPGLTGLRNVSQILGPCHAEVKIASHPYADPYLTRIRRSEVVRLRSRALPLFSRLRQEWANLGYQEINIAVANLTFVSLAAGPKERRNKKARLGHLVITPYLGRTAGSCSLLLNNMCALILRGVY